MRSRLHHFLRRDFLRVFLVACSLMLLLGAAPGSGPETVRILFVGNSYTAGQGGADDLVRRTAEERGISVTASRITSGGFTLQRHWNNEIGTRDRIAEGWDIVVLQEQSLRPIDDPELFFQYARLLDQDIRAMGGETLFFLTWAREWAPEAQEDLNAAYCAIARELQAGVAPVGMAWALARERDPKIQLHSGDGSHQSALGQYLLGMTFHRRLWNESPIGLSHEVSPNLTVTPQQAAWLQAVAVDAPRECALIFSDGFESGDLAAWASVSEKAR